jgi:hypothetical protein
MSRVAEKSKSTELFNRRRCGGGKFCAADAAVRNSMQRSQLHAEQRGSATQAMLPATQLNIYIPMKEQAFSCGEQNTTRLP